MKPGGQRSRHSQQRDRRILVPVLFVTATLAIIGATVFHENQLRGLSEVSSVSDSRPDANSRNLFRKPITFDQRVLEHRTDTGDRINRQRVMTQIENTTMPGVTNGVGSGAGTEDQVMLGVPLIGESNPYSETLEPSQSLPEYDLEAGTVTSIKEERERYEQERRANIQAREQYLREFSAKAHTMGYKVKIDRDYNVDYVPLDESERSAPIPGNADSSHR